MHREGAATRTTMTRYGTYFLRSTAPVVYALARIATRRASPWQGVSTVGRAASLAAACINGRTDSSATSSRVLRSATAFVTMTTAV